MAFPAANDISTAADEGELKQHLEDTVAAAKRLPGGSAESLLTIASGVVTATRDAHAIATEGGGASDDLTNVLVTSVDDGNFVTLRADSLAQVVTLKHNAGGAGYMDLRDGRDCVLDTLRKFVKFRVDKSGGTHFLEEVERHGFDNPGVLEANSTGTVGSPNIIALDECGKRFTNTGATAQVGHTLPPARAGLVPITFIVTDADGIRILAAAGDKIRIAATESAVAGYIEATTIGNTVTLVPVDDTTWYAIAHEGTWTFGP